jgi:hypothetical protein
VRPVQGLLAVNVVALLKVLKDVLFGVAEALHDDGYFDVGRHSLTAVLRPRRREGSRSARQNAARGPMMSVAAAMTSELV